MKKQPFHFKVATQTLGLARWLRGNMTKMERKLWHDVLSDKYLNAKFLRQKPIGIYIADFYCPKAKLIIEVDGDSHDKSKQHDKIRTKFFNKLGIKVLRFTNEEIKKGLEIISIDIEKELQERIKKD